MKAKTNRLYFFNGFQLAVDEGSLKKGPHSVPLTRKAFETLVVLLENRGQVVDKEIILNKVWSDAFVEEAILSQNIFTLRRALGALAGGKQIIETVPRRGYKFVGEVSEVIGGSENAAPRENLAARPPAASEKTTKKAARVQLPEKIFGRLSAGALLIFTISLFLLLIVSFQTRRTAEETNFPTINSIAVLPLRSIDRQSSEEKLGLGMADAIIIRLGKLQKIPVRPTSSVFRFVEQADANTQGVGRDLSVDAVLEGTVQRGGGRVRVSVQLIGVTDGKTLWAETFDEKSGDIFALQDSISRKVAQSLTTQLTPQQQRLLEQRMTSSQEAFEAYQTGVYFRNTRTEESLNKAATSFQKAVELDPGFAQSFAMLADTYNQIGFYGFSSHNEMLEKARAAATQALALDETIAEAHIAMSAVQNSLGNYEEAQKSIERAVDLAPFNSTARSRYAWIIYRFDRKDEAVSQMRLAREYDPLSPFTNGSLCTLLLYREDFAEAVRVCEKSYELAPEAVEVRLRLAYAYFYFGRTADAIKLAEIDSQTGARKLAALGTLGYFYVKTGRAAEAETIVGKLKADAEIDPGLFADLAIITYALGRKDEAFEHFRKLAEKKRFSDLSFKNNPMWKELREDSRFTKSVE